MDTVASLHGIGKVFGGTVAAHDVTFDLHAGEVLALVGENGAGKSTCVKMLAGVYRPDAGTIVVDGQPVDFRTPVDAKAAGVAVVHQHPGLFPELSVAENVFARQQPRLAMGLVDHATMRTEARTWLDMLGLDCEADLPLRYLSTSEQQLVEIARALASKAHILVLDEPTAALTSAEVERMFGVIGALADQGVAMMFVGHRMEEIFTISDRIAVMRDGGLIDVVRTSEVTQSEVIRMMVGRPLGDMYPHNSHVAGDVVLNATGLSCGNQFQDINLRVRAGEVVGMAGLVGSGRTEVARCLFGAERPTAGTIELEGVTLNLHSTAEAMRHGIAYVSEDRRGQSVVEEFSILHNATLPVIGQAAKGGLVARSRELALVEQPLERMKLRFSSYDQPVKTLSGGNQQKVVLAKWLATEPRLLILDEPTQGIDIQAKAEVHRIVAELAEAGMAILLISSDMPELLGVCDRITVMRQGRQVADFDREEADQYKVGLAAIGTADEVAEAETVPKVVNEVGEDQESLAGKTGGNRPSLASRLLRRREVALAVAVLALIIPMAIVNPRVLSPQNISDVLIGTALIGIVSLGEMLVVLTRNIDLSVASIIGLSAYMAASTLAEHPGLPILSAVVLAMGVGVVCGLFNGMVVAYGKVPAIVVTLGTMAVYRGIDAILSEGKQVASSQVPAQWLAFTNWHPLGMSMLIFTGLTLFVAAALVLRHTVVGRELFAVGANPDGAALIGIRSQRLVLGAFIVSGTLAGFAGALWASHYATVDGQMAYGLELTVVASVVVGGVAMRGGRGTVAGIALGTCTLLVIQNALSLAKVNPQYLQAVFGAAILLAVSVDLLIGRAQAKKGGAR